MNARFATRVLLLIAMLTGINNVQAAAMTAWLDRNPIVEGETVRLTLEVQGQVNERPDPAPLDQDFDVLGMSTGSRVNIVNGRTDARTTWTLTLSPRRSGTLTIPALHVGSYRSEPLQLEVSDAPAPVAGSAADILIETDIEPRDPYVQEQVLYTVRLLHAVPVSSGRLSEPGSSNTLVQRLGEDREYTTMHNGRRYQVIERRYALFPQSSGPLSLPAPVFDGEIPDASRRRASPFSRFFGKDSFFGGDPFEDLMTSTRHVRVRADEVTLNVRPRPDTAPGAYWLPAQRLDLKGAWQPDTEDIRTGEPLTLVLDLEAEGLTAGQLPDPAPGEVAGFTVYADLAQRHSEVTEGGVTGQVQQKIAFLPERAGELALPAIELYWWDTQQKEARVATVPGRTIRVVPVPGQKSPAVTGAAAAGGSNAGIAVQQSTPKTTRPGQSAQQSLQTSLAWVLISTVLASGWLLTVLIWWWHSRQGRAGTAEQLPPVVKPARTSQARKQFLAACQVDDAQGARAALLAWAAAHWPDDPPRGLEALGRRIQDPDARAALDELNRKLYKETGSWNGSRLAKRLQRLPEYSSQARSRKVTLAPLYPD